MSREIKTLEAIVADVRSETKRSRLRNFGKDEYDRIAYLIQREQRRLWWDYDWPFLNVRRDVTLNAGDRYYSIPSDLSIERFVDARVYYGTDWVPLRRGITMDNYSAYDSDNDQRADPAMAWDVIDTAAAGDAYAEQIEIWPIPAAEQTARFSGTKALAAFVSDDDNCTLDATLLTLFSALALEPERKDLVSAANRLLAKQRGHSNRSTPDNRLSLRGPEGRASGQVPARTIIIPVNTA